MSIRGGRVLCTDMNILKQKFLKSEHWHFAELALVTRLTDGRKNVVDEPHYRHFQKSLLTIESLGATAYSRSLVLTLCEIIHVK